MTNFGDGIRDSEDDQHAGPCPNSNVREAGHKLKQIAAAVVVWQRLVPRVLKEPCITAPGSAPTPDARRVRRPSTVGGFRQDVERIPNKEPPLPTDGVHSRLGDPGYTGGKSANFGSPGAVGSTGASRRPRSSAAAP